MQDTNERNQWDDTVLPFQLDRSDIRGRVARLDQVLDQVLEQHNYPMNISVLVAEAVILTAMIGQTIDLRWKLSLQIRGDGPVNLIATDYFGPSKAGEPAKIRAYAGFDAQNPNLADGNAFEKMGDGLFAILIDQGPGTQPYQGITPLTGKSLADCATTYFAQSEQLPTHFQTFAAQEDNGSGTLNWRAGGLMIQHLPKASPFAATEDTETPDRLMAATDLLTDEEEENWNRAVILMNTVEEMELIGPFVSQSQLLTRLFHEEQPRVYDPQPIAFGCTCSLAKVAATMNLYKDVDLSDMITDTGMITADCQFCGAHYQIDPSSLDFQSDN